MTKQYLEKEKEWMKNHPELQYIVQEESKANESTLYVIGREISAFEYNLVQFIAKTTCSIQLEDSIAQFLKNTIKDSEVIRMRVFIEKQLKCIKSDKQSKLEDDTLESLLLSSLNRTSFVFNL